MLQDDYAGYRNTEKGQVTAMKHNTEQNSEQQSGQYTGEHFEPHAGHSNAQHPGQHVEQNSGPHAERSTAQNSGQHAVQSSGQNSGHHGAENATLHAAQNTGEPFEHHPAQNPEQSSVQNTQQSYTIERGIVKHIAKTIIFLGIIMLISGGFRFFLGYIYGVVISLLILVHSYTSIKKALNMGQKTAKPYMFGGYSLHYVVYGLTLWAAFESKHLNFVSTVFGLLTTKIGLFSWAFINWLGPEYKSWLKKFTGRYDFNSLRK